ncbi:sugar kinase [Bosea sp. (in: a-proteobacteria)]|uniref:sugar kinase n=1 Tax=Bosea sp. (in: a-proteobacteria) TaxID=1871050 RepID=UPI0027343323|nr:sugar kinase [Bosea sp. (in: a-proteobacteria)]MDP3256401.1 sugar kinase [Bosea sp. (in: a-proteobacteria)]
MTDIRYDLLCIGEPLGEFNATRAESGAFQFGHGGDTSNCAIAAARQGAKTAYLGALGDDMAGRSIRDLWRREGVDDSHVPTHPSAPTGLYFVDHGPSGHVFSYLRAGSAASLMGPRDVPRDLIASVRIVQASGISQAISASACDAVFEAFAMAREAGVTTAYDTNLRLKLWPLTRAKAIINAACGMADIVLPGYDDATQLTGLTDADAIADFYLRLGAKIVALTLGHEGSLVATPERRERLVPIAVDAVDATGAGDCYDGAFLAEYIRTGDAFAAGAYANVAAALSTQGFSAVAPLPRRAEVEARMALEAAR